MRKAAVAGSFYPSDPKKLTAQVRKFLEAVPSPQVQGDIVALMVPHAGYDYSGATAGYAYREIADRKVETFILIGPSHRVALSGISVYAKDAFQTPLGAIPVDEALAAKLIAEHPAIEFKPEAHQYEHSLEVQLPFLQVLFKDFKILPIELGEPLDKSCAVLAVVLSRHVDFSKHVILASTDLSHFHNYDTARKMDLPTLDYIEKLDLKGLVEHLSTGKGELCGAGSVITTLLIAQNIGAKAKLLRYENSGDVSGDRGRVVGYGAAAFYLDSGTSGALKESAAEGRDTQKEEPDGELVSAEDRKFILTMTRKILDEYITARRLPTVENVPELLKRKLGLFVTLRKKGELRGCIGYIQPVKSLEEALFDMTVSSATQDTRFPPVTQKELEDIVIEISILSPLRKVADPGTIVMGKHGVVVKKGFRSGVFLPQVATETGWDRETFLDNLCAGKAGLNPRAWKEKDTELSVFTVDHFAEDDE